MTDFLPVLLGSDANVYGMARSFYQQYGVTSAAICKARLVATANSKLVRIAVVEPSLEDDAVFEKTLIEFAKTNPGKTLVLVSCADGYTILLGRHREALRPYYHFACPPVETVLSLDIKDNFYKACEAHGLSYPKTATCTADNYQSVTLPFDFPVIIKASNSMAYWNCTFPHKKKVFLAHDKAEFDAITAAIYGSSYQDDLILQEYIPGDDNCMRSTPIAVWTTRSSCWRWGGRFWRSRPPRASATTPPSSPRRRSTTPRCWNGCAPFWKMCSGKALPTLT